MNNSDNLIPEEPQDDLPRGEEPQETEQELAANDQVPPNQKHEKQLIDQARQQVSAQIPAADFHSIGDFGDSVTGGSVVMERTNNWTASQVFEEHIPAGTEISRYRIIRKLGEGGMGEVYLAQHVKFQKRLFAVKFLKRELITQAMKSRFEAEIDAMEGLRHQNVVFAHDAGEFRGSSYLVMDFVDGLSIKQLSYGESRIPINDAAEIVRQAACGLQHAHEQNMVHRDIKPSNLMLSTEGIVKILDMGLARFTDDQASQLTATQQILGTPDYMAPEQWQNTRSVDIRADIYSLGCSLYCLLAGRAPFEDEQHSSLATKLSGHLQDRPPSIEYDFADPRFEQLQNVLGKMMEKKPADRYQTPQEVAEALSPFCEGADLKNLTKDVEPVDYEVLDTRSIQDALEDTQDPVKRNTTNKEVPAPAEQTKVNHVNKIPLLPIVSVSVAVLLLVLLGILFFPSVVGLGNGSAEGESPNKSQTKLTKQEEAEQQKQVSDDPSTGESSKTETTPLESNPFSITYIRKSKPDLPVNDESQELIDEGRIGFNAFSGRLGDLLKIKVALPQPKYCYLLALNPTEDPKFKIQLCYPSSDQFVPEKLKAVVYPESETMYFGMTDGVGQQAFMLLTSDNPLPSFAEWKAENLGDEFPWRISNQTGVWGSCNGKVSRILANAIGATFRGDVIEVKSNILQKTVDFLNDRDVETSVLAFPIFEN